MENFAICIGREYGSGIEECVDLIRGSLSYRKVVCSHE